MSKPKLFYIYDPLCGWCYGFSPVIQKFCTEHAQELDIEVISGGMVVGSRVGPIGQVAPYIKGAFKDVEKATGIEFGKAFLDSVLEKGSAIFTSLPPSKALTTFKELAPTKQIDFASALQKGIYYYGKEPNDIQWYVDLAQQFGVDKNLFLERVTSNEIEEKTKKEFRFSSELGVTGFPTVVLMVDGQYFILARGAVGHGQLEANFFKVLKQSRN